MTRPVLSTTPRNGLALSALALLAIFCVLVAWSSPAFVDT